MMSTLSPAVPLGLADGPASSKEVWRRAFKLPDECVISADGDLSEEDAADRRLSPRSGYAGSRTGVLRTHRIASRLSRVAATVATAQIQD